jgi:signal transduction histidine kinase
MMRRSRTRASHSRTLGFALLLFLAIVSFSAIPLVRDSEVRLTDTFFRLAPPPKFPSSVILVRIDDESLQRYGRWPWSRVQLGRLLSNLSASGASVIGLDVLLSEPQSPEADSVLRDALAASQRTVIAGKIGSFSDGPRWMEPLPLFVEAARAVGHAHAALDNDSVCRRFPPRELTVDGPRWAFAIEVARLADPARTAQFLSFYGVPVLDNAPVSLAQPNLIRVPFRRDRFPSIPAFQVLEGTDLGRLGGHPVLVGFGPTELSDRLSTPLSSELPVPGVEIHAQILDGILTGRRVTDVALWVAALSVLLACVATVWVFQRWHGAIAAACILLLGTVVYAVGFAAFLAVGRILPAGSMMLAVILGPLLVSTGEFVALERSVTQQLRSLGNWLTSQSSGRAEAERSDLSWKLETLQKLQTELGSRYELHKALLESSQDLVAIFDSEGGLLLHNQPFAQLCSSEERTHFTLERLRTLWKETDGSAVAPNGVRSEGEVHLGGELYSVRSVPLPSTTLSPRGGTIVTLASQQVRVERDRARAEALGFITHELRTPLASIQGFAQLMMHAPGSPACATAPETIYRESNRLLALINSYLDVLRLDAGAKPLRHDILDIGEMVESVFDILRPLASDAGMALVTQNQPPVVTVADANLLSGAVLNLVSNAIKYGTPGTDIVVSWAKRDGEVVLAVHNQGGTIAAVDIPRLFDAYYRSPSTESSKPGWGLGLAFVKRIAEKHGGYVRAEGLSGGACFEIHLPADSAVGDPVREGA